jgi:hypothetical protein
MTRAEYGDVAALLSYGSNPSLPAVNLPTFDQLARGGIVGVATITDCVESMWRASPWHMKGHVWLPDRKCASRSISRVQGCARLLQRTTRRSNATAANARLGGIRVNPAQEDRRCVAVTANGRIQWLRDPDRIEGGHRALLQRQGPTNRAGSPTRCAPANTLCNRFWKACSPRAQLSATARSVRGRMDMLWCLACRVPADSPRQFRATGILAAFQDAAADLWLTGAATFDGQMKWARPFRNCTAARRPPKCWPCQSRRSIAWFVQGN